MIKQVIRVLIGVLLDQKATLEHEMLANGQQTSGDDYLQRLTVLAGQGKICEAENILLEALLMCRSGRRFEYERYNQ